MPSVAVGWEGELNGRSLPADFNSYRVPELVLSDGPFALGGGLSCCCWVASATIFGDLGHTPQPNSNVPIRTTTSSATLALVPRQKRMTGNTSRASINPSSTKTDVGVLSVKNSAIAMAPAKHAKAIASLSLLLSCDQNERGMGNSAILPIVAPQAGLLRLRLTSPASVLANTSHLNLLAGATYRIVFTSKYSAGFRMTARYGGVTREATSEVHSLSVCITPLRQVRRKHRMLRRRHWNIALGVAPQDGVQHVAIGSVGDGKIQLG